MSCSESEINKRVEETAATFMPPSSVIFIIHSFSSACPVGVKGVWMQSPKPLWLRPKIFVACGRGDPGQMSVNPRA